MTYTHTDHDFEFDAEPGYFSGKAVFQYDAEFCHADRSVGECRDYWSVTNCELVSAQLGGLALTRDMLEQADRATLLRIEANLAERLAEDMDANECYRSLEGV